MLTNRNKYIFGAVAIVIGIVIWVFFFYRSTIVLELSPDSEIKEDITATISSQDDRVGHTLPATIRIWPGEVKITAWGPRSSIYQKTVRLKSGERLVVPIKMELQPGAATTTTTKYGDLFPFQTEDYRLTAELGKVGGEQQITKILVYVHYRFSDPNDPVSVKEEQEVILAAAKRWLKDNNVPESIPVKISSEPY